MRLLSAIYLPHVCARSLFGIVKKLTWLLDGRADTDDYSAFNEVWDKPDGGMHDYLYRFLTSPDATFQHIAVWTIVQLLDSGGKIKTLLEFDLSFADLAWRRPTTHF